MTKLMHSKVCNFFLVFVLIFSLSPIATSFAYADEEISQTNESAEVSTQVSNENNWTATSSELEDADSAQVDTALETEDITSSDVQDEPSVSLETQELSSLALSSTAHVQNKGWINSEVDSNTGLMTLGTTGQSLRVEAMTIETGSDAGSIVYNSHVQNIGWQGDVSDKTSWKTDGELSGTTGQSLRLEAIQIALTGDLADQYDIYYRVHAQNIGWMGWAKNGAKAGTSGYSYRLEAIQVLLVEKGGSVPEEADKSVKTGTAKSYLNASSSTTTFTTEIDGVSYSSYKDDNSTYLFLPSSADLNTLVISGSESIVDSSQGTVKEDGTVVGPFEQNGTVNFVLEDGSTSSLTVMKSDLACVDISLNGVTLSQINSGSKDTKYENNTIKVYDPSDDGELQSLSAEFEALDEEEEQEIISSLTEDFDDEAATEDSLDLLSTTITDSKGEIKGRGNTSWQVSKKPYQIKFNKKQNVLGMGSAKKWVLLANWSDNSLMRNAIALDTASKFGVDYTSEYHFVDLFIDGEYLGNYVLCEKVEIGSTRVNLKDDKGVLVELDNAYWNQENYTFTSAYGDHFVLKESKAEDETSSDSQALAGFKDFETTWNKLEACLNSDNKNYEEISSLIDIDSFIKMYWILEFSENHDNIYSSFFLYKDGPDDVIHAGPVWDYDGTFGNLSENASCSNPSADYMTTSRSYGELYKNLISISEIYLRSKEIFNSDVAPVLNQVENKIRLIEQQLQQSQSMNFVRWKTQGIAVINSSEGRVNCKTYTEEVDYLSSWIKKRIAYLDSKYLVRDSLINYSTHVQDYGWQSTAIDGEVSGTSGESKRLEAISINLGSLASASETDSVIYNTHIQNIGWQNDIDDKSTWLSNGQLAGTSGQSLRLEAIQIALTGDIAEKYDIYYRVHAQNIGWMGWAKNGEIAGTAGYSYRLEAIQIVLVEKDSSGNSEIPNLVYEGQTQTVPECYQVK